MSRPVLESRPGDLPPFLSRGRLLTVAALCAMFSLLLGLGWNSWLSVLGRVFALGLLAMLAYATLERWPRHLPGWIARWVLQVAGVAIVIPASTLLIYLASTAPGAPPFWEDPERLSGFATLSVTGVLVAPWVALAALVRQKDALARHQALAFDLQRSELERQALDARLQLLQRQVAPHFLFNTLANVQALIEVRSPRAADLMRSLIAYLRAAVPRLHEPMTTLAEEVALVRAYLALMHMRIPDRLSYTIEVEGDAHTLRCPSMTLLTLVENAVKHGIDPAEDGGGIAVHAWSTPDHWHLRVDDTGAGLAHAAPGLGTGLSTLRDRLALEFGTAARLQVSARPGRGVRAEVVLPVQART